MPGPCAKCQKTVYHVEETKALGKIWHAVCLKCTACNKRLETGSLNEHEGQPYCKGCYTKNFGPKGYGHGAGGGAGPMSANYTKKLNPNHPKWSK